MKSSQLKKIVQITNEKGLHARASAEFVKTALKYKSIIEVCKNNETVIGTSIMELLMLGASKGSYITIKAKGEDAKEALKELTKLVTSSFYEGE
jgi:phosphocarrier protein HPr